MTSIFIDVSGYDARRASLFGYVYDRPMDWGLYHKAGYTYAFVKSSEGGGTGIYEDQAFLMQWKAAYGCVRGAYHFFRCNVNVIKQAAGFIELAHRAGISLSDKLVIDFETLDGLSYIAAMKAAASFYFEIKKAFPLNEIGIYTNYYFWTDMISSGADGNWAKPLTLWLSCYPADPTPKMVNPPLPFAGVTLENLKKDIAANKYAYKVPQPWTKPNYLQFTAWVDSRAIPGHPAIKKVVDLNIAFSTSETPAATPVVTPVAVYPKYVVAVGALNIRKGPGTTFDYAGSALLKGVIVNVVSTSGDWAHLDTGAWCYLPYLTRVS